MDYHNATSNMNFSINGANNSKVHPEGSLGRKCGSWIRRNKYNVLGAVLIVVFMACLIGFLGIIADAVSINAGSSLAGSAALYSALMHNKCKGRGGCSRKCPFVTEDDPRVVMDKQVRSVQYLYNMLLESNKNELESMELAKSKFPTSDSTLADHKAISEKVIPIIDNAQLVKSKCINNVLQIQNKIMELDKQFGLQEKVTVEVLNAKTVMTALQLAGDLNKNAFVAAVAKSNAFVMWGKMKLLEHDDKMKHIQNFDDKIFKCNMYSNAIDEIYQKITSKIMYDPNSAQSADVATADTSYANAMVALLDGQQDNDITQLADLLNKVKEEHDQLETLMTKYSAVATIYNECIESFQSLESFNNDMPGQLGAREVSALIEKGEYDTALIRTALEPEVVTNHIKFARERSTFDSGGGVPSVPDHDHDIGTWVGLFGRPSYRRSDGSSADKSSEPLRSIPSDNPEDLMRVSMPKLSFV